MASDPICGLALLKVNRGKGSAWFPRSAAPFAPDEKVRAGEFQLVAGNPAALAQSGTGDVDLAFVTRSGGSAGSRSVFDLGGNLRRSGIGPRCWLGVPSRADRTGSPVFNLQGELTGLVPFQQESLSHLECLPLNGAMRRIVEELKQGWDIRYGDLGAVWAMRTEDAGPHSASGKPFVGRSFAGRSFREESGQSPVVQEAIPGSPAARAGLQRGDILRTLNGQAFQTLQALEQAIALIPPGTVVQLTLFRPADQQEHTLTARLARRPLESVAGRVVSQPRFPDWRGMRVDVPVTGISDTDSADDMQASVRPLGVVVTEVVPDGPADRAGLKPDDWIFQVGSRPIESPEEFYAAVATWSGSTPLTVAGRGELLVEIP
jgi:serine protease Do